MNLLIVDDIAADRKLLRVTLEAEGHAALEAADGVEALAVLGREKVDAVISDILMPNMDGFRLCHEIRKKAVLASLPIIIYTSTYTSPNDMKLAETVGADRYLTKPVPAEILLQALQEAVVQRAAGLNVSTPEPTETQVLKQYNETLVRKLENRNLQLGRQNEELLRLQELYRDLLENTNDLTQTLALDGRILFANRACQKALGYQEDELARLTVFDLIHSDHRTGCRQLLQQIVAAELPAPAELRLFAKGGREIVVQANLKVLHANGVPVALRCILRDVTSQHILAEEHSRLASRLSHHLRTPLNGILGLADLLRTADAAWSRAEVQDMTNSIYNAALRLERVTGKLLDLVELEAIEASVGQAASLRRPGMSETREFLENCACRVATEHRREMDLTLSLAEGGLSLSAYWLGRLVARPLDNAFRYSQAGTSVHLETHVTPHDFMIVIRDRGQGMTPEQLGKCGHLQPTDPTEGDQAGVGAGLVVARHVTELAGGSLAFDSAPGQGTTVTIRLPVAHGQES